MDTKSFLTSRTLWGVLILALGRPALAQLGLDLSEQDAQAIADWAIAVLGGGLAIWGRLSATKKLTVPGAAGPALVHAGEYMLTRGDVADIQGGAKRLGIPQDSGQALVLNYSPTINVNGGNKAEVMAILAQERVKIARMLQPRPQQLRSGV